MPLNGVLRRTIYGVPTFYAEISACQGARESVVRPSIVQSSTVPKNLYLKNISLTDLLQQMYSNPSGGDCVIDGS